MFGSLVSESIHYQVFLFCLTADQPPLALTSLSARLLFLVRSTFELQSRGNSVCLGTVSALYVGFCVGCRQGLESLEPGFFFNFYTSVWSSVIQFTKRNTKPKTAAQLQEAKASGAVVVEKKFTSNKLSHQVASTHKLESSFFTRQLFSFNSFATK
jgi:hypothetical protein